MAFHSLVQKMIPQVSSHRPHSYLDFCFCFAKEVENLRHPMKRDRMDLMRILFYPIFLETSTLACIKLFKFTSVEQRSDTICHDEAIPVPLNSFRSLLWEKVPLCLSPNVGESTSILGCFSVCYGIQCSPKLPSLGDL